jgi:hypothetical protein
MARVNLSVNHLSAALGVERDTSFARRADAIVARFRAQLNTAG